MFDTLKQLKRTYKVRENSKHYYYRSTIKTDFPEGFNKYS